MLNVVNTYLALDYSMINVLNAASNVRHATIMIIVYRGQIVIMFPMKHHHMLVVHVVHQIAKFVPHQQYAMNVKTVFI